MANVLLLDVGVESPRRVLSFLGTGVVPMSVAPILVADVVDAELIEFTRRTETAGLLSWPFSRSQFMLTLSSALGAYGERRASLHRDLSRVTTVLQRIAEQLVDVQHLVPPPVFEPRLRPLPELALLSPREHEVLKGLTNHKRVAAIAQDMHISPHTVRNHLKSIFSKLSVHSQHELLEKVVERPAASGPSRPDGAKRR
jgi:DNA-binding CsgD family transcriptional regulator